MHAIQLFFYPEYLASPVSLVSSLSIIFSISFALKLNKVSPTVHPGGKLPDGELHCCENFPLTPTFSFFYFMQLLIHMIIP